MKTNCDSKQEKETMKVVSFFRKEIEYYRSKKQKVKNSLFKCNDEEYISLKKKLNSINEKLQELAEIENNLLKTI